MKLQDEIKLYSRAATSDGAGGMTPGALTEEYSLFADVKPMSGSIGMQFQQLTGTQGYEVWIRTDFDREPKRGYIVRYSGIYGDLDMVIQSVGVYKNKTKLICQSENKL
jgi:head-tail adaptor